jgi:hypothetical protein
MTVERLSPPVERLVFEVVPTGAGGELAVRWDDRRLVVLIRPAG